MPLNVWIDPAHGGNNRGICYAGLIEKDWTLEFNSDFQDWYFDTRGPAELHGVEFWSARHDDTNVKYNLRAQAAAEVGADVAFIHHVNGLFYPKDYENAALAGKARPSGIGASAFVMYGDTVSHKIGEVLLKAVQHPLKLWHGRTSPHWSMRFDKHGKKHWTADAWSCLRHYAKYNIPTVLIEWGFGTSDYDRRLLMDKSKRELFYRPLSAAIRYALEQKEKSCRK